MLDTGYPAGFNQEPGPERREDGIPAEPVCAAPPVSPAPRPSPAFTPAGGGVQTSVPVQIGSGEAMTVGRYHFVRPQEKNSRGRTISREHARVARAGDAYTLTDLNSTNGTWLNGERMRPNVPYPLRFGDRVAFSNVECVFSAPERPNVPDAPPPPPDPSEFIFCITCGSCTTKDSLFCPQCGAPLKYPKTQLQPENRPISEENAYPKA